MKDDDIEAIKQLAWNRGYAAGRQGKCRNSKRVVGPVADLTTADLTTAASEDDDIAQLIRDAMTFRKLKALLQQLS